MEIVVNISIGDIKKSGFHLELAKKRGITNLVVPKENIREASLVKGINIFGFEDFIQLSDNSKGISSIEPNAEMTPALIKEFCLLEEESKRLLQMAFDRFNYNVRIFHKFLKVARTCADMDGAEKLSKRHIVKALMCRGLEKERRT